MTDVKKVTLGSTFRMAWVSSGAAPSPITFNLFSGSETLVNSFAAVDSGNGLFYADVVVSSIGLWKGSWFAYVAPNSFRNDTTFAAYPNDTDQPGRYITWDDVINRFPGFTDTADAVKAASHYVSYAEAYIDSKLAVAFDTPFSSNNTTIRDLAIDVVYARSIRSSQSEEYKNIWAEVTSRIAALLCGDEIMITNSGGLISMNQDSTPAWSNTEGYNPLAAVTLPFDLMIPSSQQMQDEADERGYTN